MLLSSYTQLAANNIAYLGGSAVASLGFHQSSIVAGVAEAQLIFIKLLHYRARNAETTVYS